MGQKIDLLLTETIEAIAIATFLPGLEKLFHIQNAIRKMDTLKIFLQLLWESKSLDDKKFITLSEKAVEIGRMLGGWYGKVVKQNSPQNIKERKKESCGADERTPTHDPDSTACQDCRSSY